MTKRYVQLLIVFGAILWWLYQGNSSRGQGLVESGTKAPEPVASNPPMGWNSWNWFGKLQINERVVTEVIDAIVESGLRDAGYKYVVIDGGWRDTKLGPVGELLPHPQRFPNG